MAQIVGRDEVPFEASIECGNLPAFSLLFYCDSIIFYEILIPILCVCYFVRILGRMMKIMHSCKVIIQGYDILRTRRVVCLPTLDFLDILLFYFCK
jgi:hypothetical protein